MNDYSENVLIQALLDGINERLVGFIIGGMFGGIIGSEDTLPNTLCDLREFCKKRTTDCSTIQETQKGIRSTGNFTIGKTEMKHLIRYNPFNLLHIPCLERNGIPVLGADSLWLL